MAGMTKIILGNLASKPATRPHPFEPHQPMEGYRGELINDPAVCILCGMCQRTCPSACLQVSKAEESWRWHPLECVFCGNCVEVCPVDSLSMKRSYLPVQRQRLEVELHVPKKAPKKKTSKTAQPEADKTEAEA